MTRDEIEKTLNERILTRTEQDLRTSVVSFHLMLVDLSEEESYLVARRLETYLRGILESHPDIEKIDNLLTGVQIFPDKEIESDIEASRRKLGNDLRARYGGLVWDIESVLKEAGL